MKKKVILIKILKHVPQNWPGLQARIYTLEKNTVISILGGFSFWDDEIVHTFYL